MITAWRQATAIAAAAMAAFIQQQAARKAAAIAVVGQQQFVAHQAGPAGTAAPALAMHAAAAMLKCLPYELPSMTAALGSVARTSSIWATPGITTALAATEADLYGVSIDAGVTCRPLLAYQPPSAAAQELPLQSAHGTCTAVSGMSLTRPSFQASSNRVHGYVYQAAQVQDMNHYSVMQVEWVVWAY